jgi:hypothetical protein
MKRTKKRVLPRAFKMPWGNGQIIEEASFVGRWHEPAIQLMKYEDGALAIRFAHYGHGAFQRSPLIVNVADLRKLKRSLDKNKVLKRLLKQLLK